MKKVKTKKKTKSTAENADIKICRFCKDRTDDVHSIFGHDSLGNHIPTLIENVSGKKVVTLRIIKMYACQRCLISILQADLWRQKLLEVFASYAVLKTATIKRRESMYCADDAKTSKAPIKKVNDNHNQTTIPNYLNGSVADTYEMESDDDKDNLEDANDDLQDSNDDSQNDLAPQNESKQFFLKFGEPKKKTFQKLGSDLDESGLSIEKPLASPKKLLKVKQNVNAFAESTPKLLKSPKKEEKAKQPENAIKDSTPEPLQASKKQANVKKHVDESTPNSVLSKLGKNSTTSHSIETPTNAKNLDGNVANLYETAHDLKKEQNSYEMESDDNKNIFQDVNDDLQEELAAEIDSKEAFVKFGELEKQTFKKFGSDLDESSLSIQKPLASPKKLSKVKQNVNEFAKSTTKLLQSPKKEEKAKQHENALKESTPKPLQSSKKQANKTQHAMVSDDNKNNSQDGNEELQHNLTPEKEPKNDFFKFSEPKKKTFKKFGLDSDESGLGVEKPLASPKKQAKFKQNENQFADSTPHSAQFDSDASITEKSKKKKKHRTASDSFDTTIEAKRPRTASLAADNEEETTKSVNDNVDQGENYVCDHCSRTFQSGKKYEKHVKKQKCKTLEISCSVLGCSEVFQKQRHLDQHFAEVH